MNGDKFDQLYNALKADGAISGTRENFNSFVYAKGAQGYKNRKKLYDALHADGAVSSKSYEEFAQKLGLHAITPSPSNKVASKTSTNSVHNKPRTVGQMAQQVGSQYKKGSNPFENWDLLNKKDSQMTPFERSKASTMRSNMQSAARQAYQQAQKQKNANPIAHSRVNTKNPLAAVSPKPYSDTSLDMDETTQRLSTPEAQKERVIQQHKDDTMALANNDVNSNAGVMSAIDATVSPSMQEADELAWSQYQEQLRAAGGDAYLRDKAWKDLQDNRYKNRQEILSRNLSLKLQDIYQDKNLQRQVVQNADKMNMSIEEYVDKYVTPQMMQRAQNVLGVKNIEEIMPKNAAEYVVRRLSDSILGTLSAGQDKSKDSIMREQQAMAIADGLEEMPEVKGYKGKETYRSGVGARFISTAANMAMDSPFLGMTGGAANLSVDLGKQILTTGLAKVGLVKAGAKLTAQQLGFKVANMTMAQKIGSGLLEGTAKGALNLGGYSGITAALGQASTGDDTSLGALAQTGFEGFKHGATTGAMFGASGAVMAPWIQKFGINGTETTRGQRILHGAQKVGASALGIGVEAGTMMVADNVTGDKEISVGQWLEDVVMVGAFKAGEPRNYGKIGEALHSLTHNTSSTFRFGKDSDGNWRQVDIRLTDAEKNELIGSTSGKNLMDSFVNVSKAAKKSPMYKSVYKDFMRDPNVSQSTKEKVNAAMGLFNTTRKRSYRSVNDAKNKQVLEYAQDGTLLTRTSYKNADERRDILYRQKTYRDNDELLALVGYAKLKDRQYLDKDGNITEDARNFLMHRGYDNSKSSTDPDNAKLIADMRNEGSELYRLWAENRDMTGRFSSDDMKKALSILAKDPMKRTYEEQESLRNLKTVLESQLFPENEAHADQSQSQGRSIAEEEGLGSDTPNPTPVVTELRNLSDAEDALQELMDSNDDFKQNYDVLRQRGLTNPQIYDAMIQQVGLTQEELEPFARYINANARVQGMQQATQEAIEQRVESVAGDWGFHGTMDGQQADGSRVLYVKDGNGRTLIVGTGDVSYDPTTGRPREDVGDMLVGLDVQTREPVYVKVEDTTLDQIQNVEDFKNEERQRLQQINSAPYNQAAQEQAMKDATKPQPKEEEAPQKKEQPSQENNRDLNATIDKARSGDKESQDALSGYGIDWGTQGVYRFVNEDEVNGVLNGETYQGRNGNGNVDVTASQEPTTAANADYRITFKPEHDLYKEEGNGNRARMKNPELKDGYIMDGYSLKDVERIEKRNEDGSYTSVYDSAKAEVKNGNEDNTSLTFEDGSPVPMVKDSKGRLTPDYGNMEPEQAAEILTKQFGESAEKVVDGQIKKAEKAVKDAEKMKVDYEGEPNDILEQENLKKQTIDAANKQLEHAQAIKKAMTAKKVAETMAKKEEPKVEGANQAGSVAAQKFQGAPRLVGNKRSRTLPNNEKIKGHYEIVPAESLTPSHDSMNGYKKSEGFPVDKNGNTINDRDYENDKAAQQSTDQIALKYNGQAIEQVPVVSDEGIVYDGNGRTMAGQKAAKDGTDGEYIGELLENAENFGFTREQIEKSGIDHPRLVLVTDERMPYDTATFAKFNRNEKKTQSNTEQAVAKSKTLSPKDVGAIVAEIEGNGSLEAFFNNPNAISSLWKTLQEKGIIGQNEVAGLQDMPGVPNAQGKEFIKNLVLGAMFKPETIRMMGIDSTIKNKAINGIRAIMDNSKLGDYALSDEIDGAIRLLYEARRNKSTVDGLLMQSNFAYGDTKDRFSLISQALAQALEGKISIFRDLISEYNEVAKANGLKHKDAKEQRFGGEFDDILDKDELVKEFVRTNESIKQNNIKLYGEEGRITEQKNGDVPTGNEERPEEAGGGTGEETAAESKQQVEGIKSIFNRYTNDLYLKPDDVKALADFIKDNYGYVKDAFDIWKSENDNRINDPNDPKFMRERRYVREKEKDFETSVERMLNDMESGLIGSVRNNAIEAVKIALGKDAASAPVEKSEPITITTEHGGEKTFSSEQVDLAKKIIFENPEKPITNLQRQMKIGYEDATALAKELGWQEKPTFMPKEQKPTNPIEKAAEDYKKEHPMTEKEIMEVDGLDDEAKYTAIDYLNGEDDSEIARICYEQAYNKRKSKKRTGWDRLKELSKMTPEQRAAEEEKGRKEYEAEKRAEIQKKFEAERDSFKNEKNNEYADVLRESATPEEAATKFRKMAAEKRAVAADWGSRVYKKNNTALESHDIYGDEKTTTISAANERRRKAAISNALKSAEDYDDFADTLLRRCGLSKDAVPVIKEVKEEPFANPMEALKKAASEYSEPKVETAKPKTIAEKKAAVKKLKAESDKKTQDLMNQFLAAKDEKKNGSGKALSTLIPIPSKALKWMDRNLTLTDKQKELLPQLLSAIKGSMYARIKEGIYNLEDVIENVHKDFKAFFDALDKDDANKILAEAAYKGRFTDPETGERIKLSDAAERERKLSPEHQEKLVGDSKTAEERKQKENSFINRIQTVLAFGEFKSGIVGLRKIAEGCGLEGVKDTDLQELAETAVIGLARQYASSKAMSDDVKFAKIKELYNRQPSLNQRDSDRVEKQQYSTPAPYAYLADMYVKGNGKEIKSALEPSAGNGMLTIGLPMDKVHVNDIDESRLLNLHRQGFKNITSQDGTQPFADKDVDVVVTNPPFGTATPKEYDGYKISSLEGQMAINALESMKDDGRAAIIIGGKTEYAKNGSLNPKDKAFLGYLYSHYNVEDVINVDGSLYAKQGTTYPTRIILINGRRAYNPENKVYPPIQKEARAESVKYYDELYKRINDDILRNRQQSVSVLNEQGGESGRVRADRHVREPNEKVLRGSEREGREVYTSSASGDIRSDKRPSETSVPELGSNENTNGEGTLPTGGGTSVRDGGGTVPSGQNDGRKNDTSGAKPMGEGNRGGRPNTSGVSGRGDNAVRVSEQSPARGVGLKETPKRELSTEKVKYVSKSSNPFSLNSVIPADQAKVTNKALDKIGDVDEFLVNELGYNDKEDMYHALGSEQADSVALAIHQAKQGNAFIIGDMTGIGKGRQAAAMIRYAYKSGKIPVFITAKKALFSDMYRDLKSIGNAELRPFIWSAKDDDNTADMIDSEGNLVYKRTSDSEQKRVMEYLKKFGKLPDGYDYIVTTYDSFNSGTMEYNNGKKVTRADGKGSKNGQAKRELLELIAKNANVIMDESHKAGGNGNGSAYFQYIVPKLNAITFLSATYAKKPENMPIYALRTSMNQAGVEPAELIDAIKRGGTTLQEIMSQSLAASGQFIRRERDMTGVTIDWKAIEDPVVVQEQREQYDSIIGLFNDIIDFQRTYVDNYIDQRNEEVSKIQGSIKNRQGTKDLGIRNTPFASRTYNMVQQVLLSLKAKEAAKSAIEHLKNGEKVVIALNNTNESQTGEYAEGTEIDAPDLGVVLKKGLVGVLRYEQSDDMGKKSFGSFNLEDLGEEASARYHQIEDNINNASTGLSLSPIDVIRDELEAAGYKVGELTGRTYQFVKNQNGTVSKVKRTATDKKKLALDFNTDKLDALILNRSASTGISLHDSKDFNVKEHKPRTMIVVQQQADVNEEVQMRGRIDRTGQVNRGRYEYIVSQIPSEQRLLMMFKSKLRSLDANTTSSQKSKFNDMDVNDIINKYGDKVVKEYMAEHLDLYSKMADPFGWEKEGVDLSSVDPQKLINSKGGRGGESEPGADASKFLARMALLKVADQEKMLKEIGELYTNEINRLNEMGENDLEITELPLKAKTIGKEVWKEGSEPNGDNAFADNTYIEKVNMAILKKPMRGEEVKKAQEGLTGGRSWDEYRDEKRKAMKEYFQKKIADEKERLHGRAMKLAQKAAEKYGKEAKKNQEKNQLTDEQIEKNTQFQYDNVYNEEKKKAETVIKNIQSKYQAFDRVLDTFNTEDAFVLPSDMNNPNEMSAFGNSYGRLIDIKITDNYSPTASTVSFATLDGRRKITFPVHGLVGSGDKKTDIISTIYRLTRQADAMADKNYRVVNMSIDNWDRMISNESRKDGYIITGNLMQALIDTKAQGLGGQLVKYTTDNGEVKTGILMPDRFKPTDAATEKAISSKADDFMSGKIDDVVSSDGEVKLSSISNWRGTTIELRVPKSKAKGGKYFLDDELRSLVDGKDFYTKGNSMVANVQLDKVRDILERLSSLGVKVREERNGTHFRTEENIKDNESSENLFVSLQSKQNNRKDYNETVNILSERVADGRADLYGVSPQPGRETQDRVSAAIEIIAADRGGVSEAVDGSTKEQRTKSIEDAVISWAEDNGKVVSEKDVAKNSFGGEMWSKGGEANVYMSKDKTKVIKFVDPYLRNNDSIQTCMENTRLFNELFPESAYTVIGVTRGEDGKFRIAMEQPFIKGKLYTEPELDEYDKASEKTKAMFESLGLYDVDGDGLRFKNDKYFVSDIHFGNVVFDADGNPHVIDADVKYYGKYRRDNIEGKPVVVDNGTHFKTEQTPSMTQNQEKVLNHIISVSEKVGDKVSVVNSPDEVTNPAVKERLDKGENVTGWYDEKTGEVHLYLPNIHDRYTAEKTIWHETVGHKGMRGLFGDKFDNFLYQVWKDLDKPENARLKQLVDEERKYNPFDIYNAIEEGIARLAEDGRGERGFWNNIKNKITDLLHEVGYRIAPNTKDVKYLLWLGKNLQKNPNDPYWRMKANAVRYKLERESTPAVVEHEGMFFGDDKVRTLDTMTKQEFRDATDGMIHFRTTPSAATALDRYEKALNAHGYMFTESYMDNMLSLKNLMQAIKPDVDKVEDINSSENPYILQNTMQGAMSNAAAKFERDVMKPLDKAMAELLDAFEGKKDEDKIRNFNLYMIMKHGLERNRVFFVRDYINDLKKDENTVQDAKKLQSDWSDFKKDLGDELRNGSILLNEYYDKMDEWIRSNVDAEFKAGENDYSGFHGMFNVAKKNAYDDADVISRVMDSEKSMEDSKKGSVADFWDKVKAATQYSLDCEYKNGLVTKENHDNVSGMFDWYVPLRKFDDTTAEDVYGYVTQSGDYYKDSIGRSLMKAKGRKSLSETNILAQIGAMGNNAIYRGGNNAIKQAFARFIRNNGGGNLVTEMNVWLEKKGTDVNGNPIWEEALPNIPEDATADEVARIVQDFEDDMNKKKGAGNAINMSKKGTIGFKFERKTDRSQHIVDVMIAGKKHSFIVNGNPRAAQALNGMLENWTGQGNKVAKWAIGFNGKITRFFAQASTSYNPEFVMRNLIKDFEFSSTNLLAKEGSRYVATFEKYYLGLNNIAGIKNFSLSDFKNGDGFGLFAKYRNGTLGDSKVEKYFKEFMENGGETGFVQMLGMKDWTKKYKDDIKKHRSHNAAVKLIKGVGETIEGLNEVAENMARFATYCASRDHGRSVVRSTYDAKEVTVNFNRKGSGSAITSFKDGELSYGKASRRNVYGFTAWWLRNTNMFFNAGIQSTNLLLKNAKNYPMATVGVLAETPFALGALIPLVNQVLIGLLDDDEKDRKGVKNPYDELPDYVRRNNLCIYTGGGEFTTIPLAIENRAFYGLGDVFYTMMKHPEEASLGNIASQATGQIAQLVPIMDYMGTKDFGENPLEATAQAFSPSSIEPIIEWERNKDWKGQQIERRGSFYENDPAWERANTGTNGALMWLNKKANAYTNDVAKGNEEMLGNDFVDQITNPSMLQHYGGGITKGMGTFLSKSVGFVNNTAKGEKTETKDIPFVRSFFYTPSETTSMQRTKSKFYNYSDELGKAIANVKKLRSKNVDPLRAVQNASDYYNFMDSKMAQQVSIMEFAQKRIKEIKKMRNKMTDTESINKADQDIGYIMQDAVEQLDKLND